MIEILIDIDIAYYSCPQPNSHYSGLLPKYSEAIKENLVKLEYERGYLLLFPSLFLPDLFFFFFDLSRLFLTNPQHGATEGCSWMRYLQRHCGVIYEQKGLN